VLSLNAVLRDGLAALRSRGDDDRGWGSAATYLVRGSWRLFHPTDADAP
jgi:hypothetical protein